jgi:fumarate reductase flavoprotein subunit
VHGANRLGGNGVANSTVFGAVAGESMATFIKDAAFADPDPAAVEDAIARAERPFSRRPGDLEALRERLYGVMWDKVGILRHAQGLAEAARELEDLDGRLDATGVAGGMRAFNLTWHDWLNLKSLVAVSRTICAAATAREDSRGAHFREDFPQRGALEGSAFTSIAADGRVVMKPVAFTRVRPGESLLKNAA